jgi:hypothetical protein
MTHRGIVVSSSALLGLTSSVPTEEAQLPFFNSSRGIAARKRLAFQSLSVALQTANANDAIEESFSRPSFPPPSTTRSTELM